MWYPEAIRKDGPDWKVGYSFQGESGPKRGDVKHSAEGDYDGAMSVLFGPRTASWHFTVCYDRIEQHYPIDAYCWHAGDVDDDGAVAANIDLVGIEHLGTAGTVLTDYQVGATARISKWCAKQFGLRVYARFPQQSGLWTLVEHKQVSDTPTACPSFRIPWDRVLAGLEESMTQDEFNKMMEVFLQSAFGDFRARFFGLEKKLDGINAATANAPKEPK